MKYATFGRVESEAEMAGLVSSQRSRLSRLKSKPLISLACIHRNENLLNRTIDSLRSQSYENWELIVLTDALLSLRFPDPRIRFIESPFATLADGKNKALGAARGELFGLIECGDILSPVALFQFAFELSKHPNAQLLYCNEVKYDPSKDLLSEFWSKGSPSWFNLIHFNFIGRLFLIKTACLQDRVVFEPKFSPDEDLGLLLDLSLRDLEWVYIPQYLYYRTEPAVSSALRRREIVEDHLKKKGVRAYVGCHQSVLDVQPVISNPKENLISVIILFKDKPEITIRCLETLAEQKGEIPVEVILINNASADASTSAVRKCLKGLDLKVEWIDYLDAFNFGHMNNLAIQEKAKGNLLLLLNNDVFLQGQHSLDKIAAWALLESTGTVGVRLFYEHGRLQHGGFDGYFGGFSRMVRVGNSQKELLFSKENHEVFGSTFACCMMKRSTYDAIGGFREIDLANGFGDIAFNFDCLRRGLHNLFLGQVTGLHFESISRGETYEYWEECVLEREYPEILQKLLREDLGMDKIPASDDAVLDILRESALGKLRKHAPWLKTIKRTIDKRMRQPERELR